MERRRRQVQRMKTIRIWHQLIKAGYDKVDLERRSRQDLMNILAEKLVLDSLTFWWKLCEQKRFQIQEMRFVQLKQYLVKVGYREDWLRNQPRVVMMEIMAKVELAEEEKEKKRKQDEERLRRQEKKEQEEKEEKRRLEEKEVKEKEEKEYAARVLELRSQLKQPKYAEKWKEEERKRRIEESGIDWKNRNKMKKQRERVLKAFSERK